MERFYTEVYASLQEVGIEEFYSIYLPVVTCIDIIMNLLLCLSE